MTCLPGECGRGNGEFQWYLVVVRRDLPRPMGAGPKDRFVALNKRAAVNPSCMAWAAGSLALSSVCPARDALCAVVESTVSRLS